MATNRLIDIVVLGLAANYVLGRSDSPYQFVTDTLWVLVLLLMAMRTIRSAVKK